MTRATPSRTATTGRAAARGCSCWRATSSRRRSPATASEVAAGDVAAAGSRRATTMSPDSQCLPATRTSAGGGVRHPAGDARRVVGPVEGGADVVAHAAVDRDVAWRRSAVDRHRLDRARRSYRVIPRRADDRPAGLERDDSAPGCRGRRHSLATTVGDAARDLLDRRRVVGGRVGDAEAAAEVAARAAGRRPQSSACSGEQALGRLGEAVRTRRSGSRCGSAARAGRARGMRADARRRARRRRSSGDAELLVLVGGGEELVRRGVHAAVDPQPHTLRPGRRVRAASATPLDLDVAVDDDRADAGRHRAFDLGAGTCCCRGSPMRAGSAPAAERDGELAAGAHVDAEAGLGDPAHDRSSAEERLARVVDRARSCRRIAAAALERGEDRAPPGRARRPRRRRRAACRTARRARRRRRRPRRGGPRHRGGRARATPAGPGHSASSGTRSHPGTAAVVATGKPQRDESIDGIARGERTRIGS